MDNENVNDVNIDEVKEVAAEAEPVQPSAVQPEFTQPVQQPQPMYQQAYQQVYQPVYQPVMQQMPVQPVPVQTAQPVPSQAKEKKPLSKWVIVMGIALLASVIFCAIQTIYIFGLTSGKYGVMTYTNGTSESRQNPRVPTPTVNPVADPSFSLVDSASIYDPNKQTLSTVEIAERVSPATVSIYVIGQIFDDNESPVSAGSGFIISEDGYVVTNAHVIDSVTQNDGFYLSVAVPEYENRINAEVIGLDVQTDIAVIKLMEDHEYTPVVLGDSDALQVGELAVAIGNPLGTLSGTVTVGVVSARDREVTNNGYRMKLIQTDASVNEGNSGGPLINSFGEVVGVINAKMGSAEGLGFAIPITPVKSVIESIINCGYVANRPYLGVTVGYVTNGSYYSADGGVYVAELVPGGPGDQAGIKVGDKILTVDGVEIDETSDIIDIRDSHNVGDEIVFVIERDGDTIELTLTIGDSASAHEEN